MRNAAFLSWGPPSRSYSSVFCILDSAFLPRDGCPQVSGAPFLYLIVYLSRAPKVIHIGVCPCVHVKNRQIRVKIETVARLQRTVGANLPNRPRNSRGGAFRDQDSAKDGQNPLLWSGRDFRNPLWQNRLSPFLSVALLQSPFSGQPAREGSSQVPCEQ